MNNKVLKLTLVMMVLGISACVVAPDGYYDGGGGPPPPRYGYYGYGPAYPWNTGVDVDIVGGYGHGGYGHGGYGGGYRGGGGRAAGFRGGGGGHR